MNMIGCSNIEDVRAEIMRLEAAQGFDGNAWQRVFAALRAQGRTVGLADAERRMESARGRQILHVRTDLGFGGAALTLVPVAVETVGP